MNKTLNVYEALCQRKSVRKCKKEIIPQKMFHHILRFQEEILRLKPEIRTEWQVINAIEGKCPVRGHFVVKAPYYLVLHSEEKPGSARNAGYMMEQMVIFLTMKGIGTCYQGAAKVPELSSGLKPAVVIALGYPDEPLYREERLAKRKPMSELCTWKEEGDTTARAVVKALILSPSAMNRQPWRFVYNRGKLHMFVKKPGRMELFAGGLKEVDCGIAMANAVLAAEEMWMDAAWTVELNLREKEFVNLDYVASLNMEEA
jgi:nitroreductase